MRHMGHVLVSVAALICRPILAAEWLEVETDQGHDIQWSKLESMPWQDAFDTPPDEVQRHFDESFPDQSLDELQVLATPSPDVLYGALGSNMVVRAQDSGRRWEQVWYKETATAYDDLIGDSNGKIRIQDLAVDPFDIDRFLVGTNDGLYNAVRRERQPHSARSVTTLAFHPVQQGIHCLACSPAATRSNGLAQCATRLPNQKYTSD